jgi:hypothetical protein
MRDETPPVMNPDGGLAAVQPAASKLGRIGLQLSLVAPAVFLLFLVLRPG